MLGIFGGSFDPVHFGHIKLAITLLDQYKFDQIRFIPCKLSPLKSHIYASANHRLEMLNIVTSTIDKLIVDDWEINNDGPSYTIETLKYLKKEYGEEQTIVLIIGVDAYLDFCKWYKYEEILLFCHIMLLQRPGYEIPETGCELEVYNQNVANNFDALRRQDCGLIFLSNTEKYDISSTMIRDNIARGEQPRFMIPGNVWNYIRRNNLYK